MNIVQMILNLLSGTDTVGKIALMLGIGQEQAGTSVAAAVSSLLAGLTGAAAKPGGAANLSNVLSQQDPGILDNLSSLFSGGGAAAASQGTNALSSILGAAGLGQIGSVLSRFTGVDEGAIGKLLATIAPVVLGVIGKQSKGMDASGIANMLAGQKENIAAAMPAGLSNMLSSAIPGLGGILGGTPRPPPADKVEMAEAPVGAGVGQGWSPLKWVVPLIIAGLILYFLPKTFRRDHENVPPVGEMAPAAESKKLITEGSALIKEATENVASITDETSAAAAQPKLQSLSSKLDGFCSTLAKLPAPVQQTVVDALRPLAANLREAAQPVLALPVVGAKVKPTLDALFSQIDKLMATPETAPAVR